MWFPLAGKNIHCTTFFDSFPRQIAQQSRSRLHDNTFTELLQPFGFLPHNILIAKLSAFEFDLKALNFIYDYLKILKQKTKRDNLYSS